MNFLCGHSMKEYKNSTDSKMFLVRAFMEFYELLFISKAKQFIIFLKIGLHFSNNSKHLPIKKQWLIMKHYVKRTGKGLTSDRNICQDEIK